MKVDRGVILYSIRESSATKRLPNLKIAMLQIVDFDPVGEYMLLIPKTAAEMSDGGIFIPEAARSGLTQGTVLKRGSLVTEYNVGDEIIFAQHSESRIEIDGNPYLILNQTNVLLCRRGTTPNTAIREPGFVDLEAGR